MKTSNKSQILAGMKFGDWEVIRRDYARSDTYRGTRYICRCVCGTEKSVLAGSLRSGSSKGCGCRIKLENSKPSKPSKTNPGGNGYRSYPKDLTGLKFGDLTVLGFDHRKLNSNGNPVGYYWKCRCVCGKETVVRRSSLVSGGTRSCGHRAYVNTCKFFVFDGEEALTPNAVFEKYGVRCDRRFIGQWIKSRVKIGWDANMLVHYLKHPELEIRKSKKLPVYTDKFGNKVTAPDYGARIIIKDGAGKS